MLPVRRLAGPLYREIILLGSREVVTPSLTGHARYLSLTNSLGFQQTLIRFARKNVVVPPLAESLSEGDVKFEKNVGDVVAEDELVASIETDKTSIPINSPVAGKIVEFLVEDSSTVTPGQNILIIDTDAKGDAPAAAAPKNPQQQPHQQQEQQASPPSAQHQPITPVPPTSTTSSQPKAAFAKEMSSTPVSSIKTDINSIRSGGVETGQRTRSMSSVKMNRMRQKIASRLKDAQNTYAMLTTFNEIDMSNLIEMRQKYKDNFFKKHNAKLGFMSAFVKASAYALKDQPIVNAAIEGNEILYRDFVDISVAVATPKGLVVPVLRNVEHMNFADIEKTIVHLGDKAKNNALTVADMEGGMHGINDKPAAVNGQVVIRPIMVVALTYDHRLIDGREAVTFLKKIKEVIEDPRVLLLDL